MTIEAYYDSPKMLKRLHEGPLGVHIDLFAARLLREGHRRQGAWRNLRVACDFSHWLARNSPFTAREGDELSYRCRRRLAPQWWTT